MSTGLATLVSFILVLLVAGLWVDIIDEIRNKKDRSDDKD